MTHATEEHSYSIQKSQYQVLDMTLKDLFNELPSIFEGIFSCGKASDGQRPKIMPAILALYEVHSVGRVRGIVIQEVRST